MLPYSLAMATVMDLLLTESQDLQSAEGEGNDASLGWQKKIIIGSKNNQFYNHNFLRIMV